MFLQHNLKLKRRKVYCNDLCVFFPPSWYYKNTYFLAMSSITLLRFSFWKMCFKCAYNCSEMFLSVSLKSLSGNPMISDVFLLQFEIFPVLEFRLIFDGNLDILSVMLWDPAPYLNLLLWPTCSGTAPTEEEGFYLAVVLPGGCGCSGSWPGLPYLPHWEGF